MSLSNEEKLKNNMELSVGNLNDRLSESWKITTNEIESTVPSLLFAMMENQQEIMEALRNLQLSHLLSKKTESETTKKG